MSVSLSAGTAVRVVEVGPRDGLQNEPEILPLEAKVAFIRALIDAGLPAVEVGSFVRADLVPQMADTEQLVRELGTGGRAQLWALVPNLKGLEVARRTGLRHIALFTAASDAFNRANVRMSVEQSLERLARVAREAKAAGCTLRGYISTAFWCPFSGRVGIDHVRRVAAELRASGCDELCIADTVGAATPGDVERLLTALSGDMPVEQLGVHFHDTRGTALANVLISLQLGVRTVDAAAGGLGGCPFAPGAQGNLATEDLLYMLAGMGIETGVDIAGVRSASLGLQQALGRALPSRYMRAGPP